MPCNNFNLEFFNNTDSDFKKKTRNLTKWLLLDCFLDVEKLENYFKAYRNIAEIH